MPSVTPSIAARAKWPALKVFLFTPNQTPVPSGTLGVRYHIAQRAILEREETSVMVAGQATRVKLATRPDGVVTAKIESDDLLNSSAQTHDERNRLRREAEQLALPNMKR